MKVVRPSAVTPAMLTTSTLVESDYAAWASGTTYAAGAHCIKDHRRWEGAAAGNIGHDPSAGAGFWIDMGPTNRWAMFDQSTGTLSTGTGTIAVTYSPGEIDAVALVDTDADSARVQLKVGSVTLYDKTKSTNAGGVAIDDWFLYFFEPIGRSTVLIFDDLPVYPTGAVTVTITGVDPGGPVSVGTLLNGRQFPIGETEAGVSASLKDYSVKQTDAFGVTNVVERAFSKQVKLRTLTDTFAFDAVFRELAKLRATPALYIVDEGHDLLVLYGFYEDFNLDFAFGTVGYCSLTLEGLT